MESFPPYVRHSQCSCGLLLGYKTEQTLVQRNVSDGEAVRSQPLGFPAPEGGDGQHFLWDQTLCHLNPFELVFESWLELVAVTTAQRNNCNYNWEKLGKLVLLRKVCVRSLWRHTSKLRLSPCTLLPAGSLCCSPWHGLLFNLRGLLLVITSCRH